MYKPCKHYNGLTNKKCAAGIEYKRPINNCSGNDNSCDKYETYTPEEIAKQEAQHKLFMDRMQQGLSSCCGAELDKSRVITEGRHKGHGPRFCTKCKRVAFLV